MAFWLRVGIRRRVLLGEGCKSGWTSSHSRCRCLATRRGAISAYATAGSHQRTGWRPGRAHAL